MRNARISSCDLSLARPLANRRARLERNDTNARACFQQARNLRLANFSCANHQNLPAGELHEHGK